MTWGSNATYNEIKCRFCGDTCIDDRDEGLSSHELECPRRWDGWWQPVLIFVVPIILAAVLWFAGAVPGHGETHGGWSGGVDDDEYLDTIIRPAPPKTILGDTFSHPSYTPTDGSPQGPYTIVVTPGEGFLATVTVQNRLARAVEIPEQIFFIYDHPEYGRVMITVIADAEPGDNPDTFSVIPPEGFYTIPESITLDENELGFIEIHEYILG